MGPKELLHRRDERGLGAFHYAAINGHVEVCDSLLAIGEHCMVAQCNNGYSPMHYALEANHMKVAEWLLMNGAMDCKLDPALTHGVFLEIASAEGGAYEALMAYAVVEYQRLTRFKEWVGVDQGKRLSYLRQFLLYLEPGH